MKIILLAIFIAALIGIGVWYYIQNQTFVPQNTQANQYLTSGDIESFSLNVIDKDIIIENRASLVKVYYKEGKFVEKDEYDQIIRFWNGSRYYLPLYPGSEVVNVRGSINETNYYTKVILELLDLSKNKDIKFNSKGCMNFNVTHPIREKYFCIDSATKLPREYGFSMYQTSGNNYLVNGNIYTFQDWSINNVQDEVFNTESEEFLRFIRGKVIQ